MSRSGYTDDSDDPLALGRWRQAVKRAIEGKRGQALLRDLVQALDAMDDKRLFPNSFATADGQFCALGVVGGKRGTQLDDLIDFYGECDMAKVGQRFNIAPAMAAEIMYLNDEYLVAEWMWITVEICGPMQPYHVWPYGHKAHEREVRVPAENHPCERWERMRAWAVEKINATEGLAQDRA